MNHIAKAITAFITLLGTWLGTVLSDGTVQGEEWLGLIGVVVGTLAVFQVPNKPNEVQSNPS